MPIGLGNWEPDTPDYGTASVSDVTGMLPIPGGWGPFPSLQALSVALGAPCLGAISILRASGFYDTFAGTVSKLYHYNSGTAAFDDVSGTTYAVPDGNQWQFKQFGTVVLVVNGNDFMQAMDVTVITTFADVTAAPIGRFLDTVGDFVMIGDITSNNANPLENSIQFAFQDYTTWPVGTGNGDIQVFPDGGAVRGIAAAEAGLVFQEVKVRSMSLVGGANIFQFAEIADNRTIRAPYSLVKAGIRTYGWFQTGFEYFENNVPVPFAYAKVDQWLATNIADVTAAKMVGCSDPVNKRIYWAFRSINQTQDYYDTILIYDIILDRFSKITGAFSYIFPAVTAGVTLEGLDAYGTLDTLPYSLDSAAWGGGIPGLAGFNSAGSFGFFAGTPLEATLYTAEAALQDPLRAFVRSVTPVGDASTAAVSVAHRERKIDPWVWNSPSTIGVDGTCPQRASGRLHKAEIHIDAGDSWTNIIGIEVDAVPDGNR